AVQEVHVVQDGRAIEMRLVAEELPEVDIWGSRQRASLFENIFDTSLRLNWCRPGEEPHRPSDADAASDADNPSRGEDGSGNGANDTKSRDRDVLKSAR